MSLLTGGCNKREATFLETLLTVVSLGCSSLYVFQHECYYDEIKHTSKNYLITTLNVNRNGQQIFK